MAVKGNICTGAKEVVIIKDNECVKDNACEGFVGLIILEEDRDNV